MKKKVNISTQPQLSTTKAKSLVKVIINEGTGRWLSPERESTHLITAEAKFPVIKFEIDTQQAPPYKWSWELVWEAKISGIRESTNRGKTLKIFSDSGSFESRDKFTTLTPKKVMGGTLTVEVETTAEKFKRTVVIKGVNPSKSDVQAFLKTIDNISGFDKILEQESNFKNFINVDGEPIVAFDSGYGMTQMTNPVPSFEQVWSWKENIKGGATLYQTKQIEAKAYLGQSKRSYTEDQLKLETRSRWNGGGYHTWESKSNSWIRNDKLLCDSKTGNIGWDTSKQENSGKTEEQLHDRDVKTYQKPPPKNERNWTYTGVCYADHLNSK